jgi:UrcA family protein
LTRKMIFALGCAFAMAAAAPASFAEQRQMDVRVAYGDLDLSGPHGSAVLLHRLHDAALIACGASEFSNADMQRSVERSACFHESLGRAVADVDAPTLTHLYNDHAFAAN